MRYLTQLSRAIVAALVLAVALSASITASAQTVVYDAVNDFSTEISTGVWSYGMTTTRGSQFSNYTHPYLDFYHPPLARGLTMWNMQGFPVESAAYVVHNGTGAGVQYYQTVAHSVGILNLHPGAAGENSVVRWTAPAAGMYQIKGRFVSIDRGVPIQGPSADVAVLHNSGINIFSSELDHYGDQRVFTLYVNVAVGDTIDFSVGYGTSAHWDNIFDSTGLSATIKPFEINGRLTDDFGNGVAGREIRLEFGTQWISTMTDSDGRYSFNGPMVGTSYIVRAVITDCERRRFRFTPETYSFPSLNEPQTANFGMTTIKCPPRTICREEPPCPL
ncbi:MAG: alpha-galactosidase [Pyrinomonadaceae bacterium]|jgi:hypothetical protein|nr:alpha-galactosidase [Pyrinomonadaceae bacterium]